MTVRESDGLMTEMEAMAKVAEIIGDLPNCAARARVVRWAADYFCAGSVAHTPRPAPDPAVSPEPSL